MQDQAVVPDDVELLGTALDQLDHTARRRYGAVEKGCFERQHSPAYQGRSQRSGRAVNCFAFGHEPNGSRGLPRPARHGHR